MCPSVWNRIKHIASTWSLSSSARGWWSQNPADFRMQHISMLITDSASLPSNVQFNCWHWGDIKVGTQGYTGFSLQFDLIRVWFTFSQDTMWESSFEKRANQPSSSQRGHPAFLVRTCSFYNHWNKMATFWDNKAFFLFYLQGGLNTFKAYLSWVIRGMTLF